METSTKKPRLAAAVVRHGFISLPRSVVDLVLDNLIQEPARVTKSQYGKAAAATTPPELLTLASVSTSFKTLFTEISSERELSKLTIDDDVVTRSRTLELRRQLILPRAFLQKLTFHCMEWEDGNSLGMWAALFSHAPRLAELDLGRLHVSRHGRSCTDMILNACSRFCPSVQCVSLPKYNVDYDYDPTASSQRTWEQKAAWYYSYKTLHALIGAMKMWSKSGRFGGLRTVSFGLNEYASGKRVIPEVMEHVITYCPNLERWSMSYGEVVKKGDENLQCNEQWLLDTKTWTRFCETFAQLTEFNWTCVPFATRFFEIFGQFPKPKLEKLWITTPENWNWDYYHSKVGEETKAELEQTGFGPTAKNVQALLRACPRLHELKVLWSVPYPLYSRFPEVMDPNVFGDDFCEALVEFCPHLERLEIDSDSCTVATITSFTDKSLAALSRLPRLQKLKLVRVGITGDGLFELFANHQADNQHVREYELSLGDHSRTTTMVSFYMTLHQFLKRLAKYKGTLPSASRRVSLHLKNQFGRHIPESCSVKFYREIQTMVKWVRDRHPYVKMRGLLIEQSGVTFKEIREFTFSMGEVADRVWEYPKYDRKLVDSQLDDVFTNRAPPPPRVRNPREPWDDLFDIFSSLDENSSDDDQEDEPW